MNNEKTSIFFYSLLFHFMFFARRISSATEKKIEFNINHEKSLKNILDTEKEKFTKTKDSLYYISYKYVLLFTFDQSKEDRISHLLTLTELWRINNNRYPLITTDVNFSLALHFEKYSNNLSFDYLNKAIESEVKIQNSKSLPHLYHIKGRLYYNEKNYHKANEYFKKALQLYSPTDYLFTSSMYNNFGMVYKNQQKNIMAITAFKKALEILAHKKTMTNEEYLFFLLVNENLADAFIKINKKDDAQILLEKLFNQNKNRTDRLENVVQICKLLYEIYQSTNNTEKTSFIIDYLKEIKKNHLIIKLV